MIWTLLDRILWGIALLLTFICALKYFIMAKENNDSDEKLICFSYSIVYFSFTLGFILYLIAESLIPGIFINSIFYGNYEKTDSTFKILVRLSYFFLFLGFTFFFHAFERIYKKTRHILTVIYIILLILLLILPYKYALGWFGNLINIYMFVCFFSILLLYTKWSRLEFKAVSSLILLGSVLISISIYLSMEPTKNLNLGPLILISAPILLGLGATIILIPTIFNAKVFSEALKNWIIIGGIMIGILFVIGLFFIFYKIPLIITIPFYILSLITIFSVIYTLKSAKTQIEVDKNDKKKQILEAFTKPKKVTEEEVSISKEKRICLVCKGKLARIMYICPNCSSFYCSKCSDALSNLENACWVCETPFDESKPVSLPEKKEEELTIEGVSQKGAKKK